MPALILTVFGELSFIFLLSVSLIRAHFCGENRIPYGIEIHNDGQPTLLCSRPNCFEKNFASCDERAMKKSCESNTSWVGGFDKSRGRFLPLYVQCCEFEQLPKISDALYSNVIIKAGEYFEGEEILSKYGDDVLAFDLITNIKMVSGSNSTSYQIDIRRLHCNRLKKLKRYKPWKWP